MDLKSRLESHTVSTLKKEISNTNIKGYSKLPKGDIIKKMLEHKEKFQHIKHAGEGKDKKKKFLIKQKKKDGKVVSATKKAEPIKTNFKFNPSKLDIIEHKNIMGDTFYNIYYKDNNIRIDGSVPPKKPPYFYLDTYEAQTDKAQPRAAKGEANFYLCEVLKSLLKNKKLNLKPNSDFKLTAGNISDGHNQSKLNKYYESLGFKKDGTPTSSGSQDFKQSILSFMKNCEKFKKTNQLNA